MENRQQPAPLMTHAQAEELLRLQRRADKRGGVLHFVLFTWLFGIFYWSWLALKWSVILSVKFVRLGWRWTVAYPVKWSIALCRWTWQASRAAWPYAVRGVQTFHARYGAKGWAIVGGIIVVLAVLGLVFQGH